MYIRNYMEACKSMEMFITFKSSIMYNYSDKETKEDSPNMKF